MSTTAELAVREAFLMSNAVSALTSLKISILVVPIKVSIYSYYFYSRNAFKSILTVPLLFAEVFGFLS